MIVEVLVELSNKNIDKVFDYSVPDTFINDMKKGIRVLVPFGYQELEGFVLGIKYSTDMDVKSIISVVDNDVVLNDEMLDLGKVIQRDTLSTLISCYQVMLPKALKAKSSSFVNKKFISYYRLKYNSSFKYNALQKQIISLFDNNELVLREDILNISVSSLNTLVKRGVLILELVEDYRLKYDEVSSFKYELSFDQKRVVSTILSDMSGIYLLRGVTGSGKTEVYMELFEEVIASGKTCILLVPEISLTPQMIDRFKKRFDNIATLHSGLSDGEKYDEWRRINNGEVSIVIGARSAVFAPLKNLGIIIIDEEHSDSYKQDSNPRYNAKDIAFLRGEYNNCVVVLGSATPSLESYARAVKGNYKLVELLNRVNGKDLPLVKLIDMNEEKKKTYSYFSEELLLSIRNRISLGEQVILLLNRRGYSSIVSCKNCGEVEKCVNCDISLTYHKTSNMMRCHYCGYATNKKDVCSHCGEESIVDIGIGTQKVEEELNKLFPDVGILRMDVDTTSKKGAHKKLISSFENGEASILLGTQMVAKGLDFSLVTLVGVINADTSLSIPDFRSSENTFSLLSQVAGRSGRSSKSGEVIIQTFNPTHYAIDYVKKHDYLGFYNEEMKLRRLLKYPPYVYICYIKISGKDMKYTGVEANKIKKSLERNLISFTILGVTTCNPFKLNNIFRYGITLKYKDIGDLYIILNKIVEHYKSNTKIRVDIDFNPSHF